MRLASLLTLGLLCTTSAYATTRPQHHVVAKSHSSGVHSSSVHATHASGKSSSRGRSSHHVERVSAHKPAAAPMDTERATQIQTALIKNGYLTGEPSGHWDSDSVAAMQKMQSDNGWSTRNVPDARALIKLGLGPNSQPQQEARNN